MCLCPNNNNTNTIFNESITIFIDFMPSLKLYASIKPFMTIKKKNMYKRSITIAIIVSFTDLIIMICCHNSDQFALYCGFRYIILIAIMSVFNIDMYIPVLSSLFICIIWTFPCNQLIFVSFNIFIKNC